MLLQFGGLSFVSRFVSFSFSFRSVPFRSARSGFVSVLVRIRVARGQVSAVQGSVVQCGAVTRSGVRLRAVACDRDGMELNYELVVRNYEENL